MGNTVVSVKNLTKQFTYSVKKKGFWNSLINPENKIINAVDNISFEIKKGERVAFIGPNGAGKSTSIKIMTGILHPTSGNISITGLDPVKSRRQLAFKIGTVFGQRSQLMFNLPVRDSFELFGRIYELSGEEIRAKEEKLFTLFGLHDIADQPVRKLSLGQRMRAEIALSLIHDPEIIFLDEPTIGLDIVAKRSLRKILKDLNEKEGVTIFLTSHDVGDVEALCERTILINHGKVLIDKKTEDLSKEYFNEKRIKIVFAGNAPTDFIPEAEIVSKEDSMIEVKVNTALYPLGEVLKKIVAAYEIVDMTIENPPLEEVIRHMYEQQHI